MPLSDSSPSNPEQQGYLDYLLENWRKPAVNFAFNLLFDLKAAEDIVFDVFLRMMVKDQALTSNSHAKAYLFKAVRNACYDNLKDKALLKLDFDITHPDAVNAELEALDTTLYLRKVINSIMRRLTPSERKIVIMAFFENKSDREIAETLGTSIKGIRSRKSTALKKLRTTYPALASIWRLFIL